MFTTDNSLLGSRGISNNLPQSNRNVIWRKPVEKTLPRPPLSNAMQMELQRQREIDMAIPPPIPKSSIHVLPLRQSRRWAQLYECDDEAAAAAVAEEDEDRALTRREASFEQQRAEFKSSFEFPSMKEPNEDTIDEHPFSDTESPEAFCTPTALPCWQPKKSARNLKGNAVASSWLSKRAVGRRHIGPVAKEIEIRQKVERASLPVKLGDKVKNKNSANESRKPSARWPVQGLENEADRVIDLDAIQFLPHLTQRSTTPVPSLHDPEKDKSFSQECEALLTNASFDKDWLLTTEKTMIPSQAISRTPTYPIGSKGESNVEKQNDSDSPMSAENTSKTLVEIQSDPDSCDKVVDNTAVLHPPVRSSSRSGTQLSNLVNITRLAHLKDTSSNKVQEVDQANASSPATSVTASSSITTPKFNIKSPTRIASFTSMISHSNKSPNSNTSTDTLVMIEEEFQRQHQTSLVGRIKEKTSAMLPSGRSTTPSGIPPERPLPELPEFNFNQGFDQSRPYNFPRSEPHTRLLLHNNVPFTTHTLDAVPEVASVNSSTQHLPIINTTRAQEVAALKGLALETDRNSKAESMLTPALPSPSSVYSQVSTKSARSYLKRVEAVRTQIKKDLIARRNRQSLDEQSRSAERSSQLSPVSELPVLDVKASIDQLPPLSEVSPQQEITFDAQLPAPKETLRSKDQKPDEKPSAQQEAAKSNTKSPVDQLDQFPAVPTSRPGSRASISTMHAHKNSLGHTRQSSRASSTFRRPATVNRNSRQVLGPSNIVVIVDTDPFKPRFRANVRSPTPSMTDSSVAVSPTKLTHSSRPVARRESRTETPKRKPLPTKKSSARSLQSPASGKKAVSTRKRTDKYNPNNGGQFSSDDEGSLLIPSRLTGHQIKQKRRRRWNSNDIQEIHQLHQDLEEYYNTIVTQEKKLREQADEIQMMVRVLAPISRAHGVKSNPTSDAGSITSILQKERPISLVVVEQAPTPIPTSQHRTSIKTNSLISNAATAVASGSTTARASHQSTSSKERPNSNVSSTSALTDTSTASSRISASASLTDPFEYDLTLSKMQPPPLKPKHDQASHPPASMSSQPTGLSTHSSDATLKATVPQSKLKPKPLTTPLHHPPPVASILPRGKLHEESNLGPLMVRDAELFPHLHGYQADDDDDNNDEGFNTETELQRLSVNHVLTSTDQMDRAIEQLRGFA